MRKNCSVPGENALMAQEVIGIRLEEEIPAQEWDLGMDKVVTERCVYSA